jgi:hypothetical protein
MAIGYTRTPFKSYTRGLTDTTISGGLDASGVVTAAGGFVGDLTGDVAASEVTTDTINGRGRASPLHALCSRVASGYRLGHIGRIHPDVAHARGGVRG